MGEQSAFYWIMLAFERLTTLAGDGNVSLNNLKLKSNVLEKVPKINYLNLKFGKFLRVIERCESQVL